MAIRRIRSPLMTIYAVSVAAFGQASVAYLLAEPWNHMWWLAQATYAGGIFLLSYGVVLSFHTTRSFASIYSQEELMANLAAAMVRTEQALKELQFAHSELERLAATDALTGVFNRRQFMFSIKVEIARAKRENTPLSLLALDLDRFKSVNDTYGHQGGDEVLKATARAFIGHVRPTDIIARIGGEEFVVLLPKVARAGAASVGERIRTAIEELAIEFGEQIIRPTVSIGVAQFGIDGDAIEFVLAAADKRLYIAKEAGRNRVIASGP
jgi:diguanylate cyclase (GGDEF)-like protein